MTRPLTTEGVRLAGHDVARLAPRVVIAYEELDRIADKARRDGLSGSSLGGSTSGGGIAQPTEAAAVANEMHPCRQAAGQINENMAKARRLLEECESIAVAHSVLVDVEAGRLVVVRRPEKGATPKPPDEIWCRSHFRFHAHVPNGGGGGRRGLCGWCENYERSTDPADVEVKSLCADAGDDHPDWPPRELVVAHDNNKRVMPRDYDRARSVARERVRVADAKRRKKRRKR